MSIEVVIDTMNLSGGRKNFYVSIVNGSKSHSTGRYPEHRYNRALYERDHLRHVLLDAPEPNILDEKYADMEGKL